MKILDCIKLEDGRWYDLKVDDYFYVEDFKEKAHVESGKKWNGYGDVHYNYEMPANIWKDVSFPYKYRLWKGIGKNNIQHKPDFYCNYISSLKKYKNSTIMLLAGGPTTSKVLKKQLPSYDYAWSLNYCFLNKNLPKIDLWIPAKYLVESIIYKTGYNWDNNPDLYNFFDKNSPDIVFTECRGLLKAYDSYYKEINRNRPPGLKIEKPKWLRDQIHSYTLGNPNLESLQPENYFKNMFPNKTTWFHTRYASKLGIGVRLLLLAIFLGVKKIYISGIDGYTYQNEVSRKDYIDHKTLINKSIQNHAFEDKKALPSRWVRDNDMTEEQYLDAMKQGYIQLLEYLNLLKKTHNFEIINLAEDYPEISQFGRITKEYKQ